MSIDPSPKAAPPSVAASSPQAVKQPISSAADIGPLQAMDAPLAAAAQDGASAHSAVPDPALRLLHVAWLAIALGLFMHLLNVLVLSAAGGAIGDLAKQVADAAQKISWATIVCLGVALGTAAAKARAAWAGLAGMLAAPAGFIGARTMHKGVSAAVGSAPPAVIGPAVFWTLVALKSVQYALFGIVLAYIGGKRWGTLGVHALVGAGAGVLFGLPGVAVGYYAAAKAPTLGVLIGQIVNEVIFPAGCAMVVHTASRLTPR